MRSASVTALVVIAMAAGAPQAKAQQNLAPGCALPNVAQQVTKIFGPYAAAYYTAGQNMIPSSQTANGKLRTMGQRMVVCRFVRTTNPGSEAMYILLRSYGSEGDAATGFSNSLPLFTTHKNIGSVQLSERPGGVQSHRDSLLADVKWTGAGTMRDNPSINPSRLEPIAMVLVCGGKTSC